MCCRVPHRGESVEANGIRVTVESLHRNRILQVLVRLPAPALARPITPDALPPDAPAANAP